MKTHATSKGKQMSRQTYSTVSLRSRTHEILKELSERLDRSIVSLLHEAALILQAKYAAQGTTDATEVPQRRSSDTGKSFQSDDYPTAA